ncbi:MAG: glycerol-3-phosphate dehydrogenase/oxidase [Actinomycetota bacterium]|nr:glycerol-3-phosphate dehydrogenase/oxidase [Actinomycetota bacterium]
MAWADHLGRGHRSGGRSLHDRSRIGGVVVLNPVESRSRTIETLGSRTFDLLVIGGGITGAGIALDAATRGLSVALIEKHDFASGTSSKSSKLIHGGLRYLEHREFGLMREAASERDLLRRIAPNLVTSIGFFWPKWAGANAKAGLGLTIYDILAGLSGAGRHRKVSDEEAMQIAPFTRKGGGGYQYFDSQTDDVRLTLAVLKAAANAGAIVCNHVQADSFVEVMGSIIGSHATDLTSLHSLQIMATDTVNATGVWADGLRNIEAGSSPQRLQPSKGIHVLVPKSRLPLGSAMLIPSATERRLIFAIPWRSSVIVGTTDTAYPGLSIELTVTPSERGDMLASLNKTFDIDFDESDICGAYAGLRPLLSDPRWAETRDLSRRHAIMRGPKGLVTITGGKLTTFRLMAEEAVDLITRRRGRYRRCVTQHLRLGVTDIDRAATQLADATQSLGLSEDVASSLLMAYGDDATRVVELSRNDPALAEPVVEGLPYLKAELVWAVRNEMACSAADLLARRTRISLEDRHAGVGARDFVQELLSKELQMTPEDAVQSFDSYLGEVSRERGLDLQP